MDFDPQKTRSDWCTFSHLYLDEGGVKCPHMSLYTNLLETFQDFDAVVVATGRYNAPNIPDIPGLAAWAEQFPDQILHSRQYRHPEPFENKTVMIIGAGTSGVEIARDLDTHVKKLLQSVRVS